MKGVVAVAVAMVCATSGAGRADKVLDELDADDVARPPSPALEHAIRLYDKRDFYAASIELQPVADRKTPDGEASISRARLYLARSLVALGYLVPAATTLRTIILDVHARERFGALATATAILERLDAPVTQAALGTVAPVETEDPGLVQVASALRYFAGVGAAAVNNGSGAQEFWQRIERGDRWFVAANAEISRLHLAGAMGLAGVAADKPMPPATRGDDLAALVTAGRDRDPRVARAAVGELVAWAQIVAMAASEGLVNDGPAALAEARAALEQVAATDARAAVELAWLAPVANGVPDRTHAILDPEVFQAAIGAVQCGRAAGAGGGAASRGGDAVGQTLSVAEVAAAIHAAAVRASALAGGADDSPIDRAPEIAKLFASREVGDRLLAALLATPEIDREIGEATELAHELSLLNTADKAWQTTPVAAELLQTLTLLASVEQVHVAELEVRRLRGLGQQLETMAIQLGWLTSPELGVRGDLCGVLRKPGDPIVAVVAPAIAAAGSATTTPPSRAGGAPAHGCGCETGGPDAGGLAVVGAVVVARRRRRRV